MPFDVNAEPIFQRFCSRCGYPMTPNGERVWECLNPACPTYQDEEAMAALPVLLWDMLDYLGGLLRTQALDEPQSLELAPLRSRLYDAINALPPRGGWPLEIERLRAVITRLRRQP